MCQIGARPFVGGVDGRRRRRSVSITLNSRRRPEASSHLWGVTNASIRDALVELLGRPIAEFAALCIPTAQYGHPMVGPGVKAWQFISGNSQNPWST